MARTKSAHAIDLEQFRPAVEKAKGACHSQGFDDYCNSLLAMIDEQKAAQHGNDNPIMCDLCRVRESDGSDDDGIEFCKECWDGWKGSWKPIDDEVE